MKDKQIVSQLARSDDQQKPILLWQRAYARNVNVTFSLRWSISLCKPALNMAVFHFLTDAAVIETTLLFLSQAQSPESNHESLYFNFSAARHQKYKCSRSGYQLNLPSRRACHAYSGSFYPTAEDPTSTQP